MNKIRDNIEARIRACPQCFGERYVEKRTHFSGSKYSPAGTLIESVACPRCNVPNAPQPRDGGAVCTRCNGSRVVDGDACVCAGGGR